MVLEPERGVPSQTQEEVVGVELQLQRYTFTPVYREG